MVALDRSPNGVRPSAEGRSAPRIGRERPAIGGATVAIGPATSSIGGVTSAEGREGAAEDAARRALHGDPPAEARVDPAIHCFNACMRRRRSGIYVYGFESPSAFGPVLC
jgi:hypothetical protein